jgi:hypothetical protein
MSDEKDPALSTSTSPPKYSRYRSVRQAVKKEPLPEQSPEPEMARTKSMSRYRRTRPVATTEQIATLPMPSVPPIPRANAHGFTSNPPAQRDVTRRVTEPIQNPQRQKRLSSNNPGRLRPQETDDERMRRMGREAHEREEQRRKARKEQEEQDRMTRQQKAEEEAELSRKAEEAAAKRLAEQKRKDLERLQAELDAAVPTSPPPPTSPREKLRFFSRRRAQTRSSPPPIAKRESESTSLSTTKSNEPPRGIEQGGGGPQIDAPVSASNAGERVSCVSEINMSKFLTRCAESPHPMQAILDQSSNYSRNYTCRDHLFRCQYYDTKYRSLNSHFTRIICTPWPGASYTSIRAYSRCHELVGSGYTKCSLATKFGYSQIRHRSGDVVSTERSPTICHGIYVPFPETREMEQAIYHLTSIWSNFYV